MNDEQREALTRVIAYNWGDEKRDWEGQDESGRSSHIFNDLVLLRNMLDNG